MKFKITRPDGTTIEGEGTPEEIERVEAAPLRVTPMYPAIIVLPAPVAAPPLLPFRVEPRWSVPYDGTIAPVPLPGYGTTC